MLGSGQARTASPPSHRTALNPRPASIEGREYNNWGQSVKESAAVGVYTCVVVSLRTIRHHDLCFIMGLQRTSSDTVKR